MPKKEFDVITMSHVLEHVINPGLILSSLKNNLSSDGILFVEVPNCEIKKELMNSIHSHPHTLHFTKLGLENLAKNSEYDILKIEFFYSELNTIFDFIRYSVCWLLKKDFFKLSSSQKGDVIRVILRKKSKIS